MKAKIEIELRDFTVPNFVVEVRPPGKKEDGIQFDSEGIPLSDLHPETLGQLCDTFRAAVFCKAGKVDPGSGRA